MINKFLKLQFDLSFAAFAYGVGYTYLSIFYVFSFFIPTVKNLLEEFERTGSAKSIFIIALSAGFIIFTIFHYFILGTTSDKVSVVESTIWLLLYIGGGCYALYLLHRYKENKNIFS